MDGGGYSTFWAPGETVVEARDRVYAAAEVVKWAGVQFRADIAG